jgi:hypothetical protein
MSIFEPLFLFLVWSMPLPSPNSRERKMNLEGIRTIGQGYVGAVASAIVGPLSVGWLIKRWSRSVPVTVNGMGRVELLKKHESTIRVAERVGLVGIGVSFVVNTIVKNHDIRGAGLVLGLGCGFPIGWIVIANLTGGAAAIKECMVALSVFEKLPPRPFFGVIAFCIVCGAVSAVALVLWP